MAKTLTGVVTSDKADKTITITVASRETHPLYKKQYTVNRKYTAHDPKNEASTGDKVTIEESRPISKTKTWKLITIVEKAREAVEVRDEVEEKFGKSDQEAETAEEESK